tara:strand:+ start:2834 stop:3526 length:693 start_codon:yes stop_codon:yes gene_type:complete
MIDKNTTINAVSPLKRKKSYKGGTKVKKAATATSKRRGGFAKSTATSNKAGYNVQTRFKYMKGNAPDAAGPTKEPTNTPSKPYQFDKDGNVVVNNYIDVAGGTTPKQEQTLDVDIDTGNPGTDGYWTYKDVEVKSKKESYEGFWDKRIGNEKDWSDGMKTYINRWKKKNPGMEADLTRGGEIYKEWERVSIANRHRREDRTETKRVKDKFIPGTKKSNNKITVKGKQTQG